MKTKQFIPFFLLVFFVSTFTVVAQEEEEVEEIELDEPAIINATFSHIENNAFVFTYVDQDGEESDITFDKVAPEVKKSVNLMDKSFVGKKFKITYTTENVADPDDEEMLVSVRTIIALEKL